MDRHSLGKVWRIAILAAAAGLVSALLVIFGGTLGAQHEPATHESAPDIEVVQHDSIGLSGGPAFALDDRAPATGGGAGKAVAEPSDDALRDALMFGAGLLFVLIAVLAYSAFFPLREQEPTR